MLLNAVFCRKSHQIVFPWTEDCFFPNDSFVHSIFNSTRNKILFGKELMFKDSRLQIMRLGESDVRYFEDWISKF